MALVLFHTRKVREALASPGRLGVDLLILGAVGAVIGAMVMVGKHAAAKAEPVSINLSIWALPGYTVLSLARGFTAYALSLLFTLIYGSIAAHNRRAERVMIPALDILQSIPVLAFMPGLMLALVGLFPTREIGLELACVLMIFTGQVWNMTFAYHGSVKGIPPMLREAAQLQGLGRWKTFRLLELPASMIGLVWNSMMSMAGGWFFLMICEAFKLHRKDYRVPGVGSYMSEAVARGNGWAMLAGIVAMVLMIVAVDQLFWRPIVVWCRRFKIEDQSEEEPPKSWVLQIAQKSNLYGWIMDKLAARRVLSLMPKGSTLLSAAGTVIWRKNQLGWSIGRGLAWAGTAAVVVGLMLGAWALVELLRQVPVYSRTTHGDWVTLVLALLVSLLRVMGAVALGAAWTLPVGILIGRSAKWSHRLQPVIQVVASFPAPMLFPVVTMALYWLRIPFSIGCVTLMMLGTQWYILFNVIAGASAIPADLKVAAEVYHMDRKQRWFKLYLPCVYPHFLTGLVTAAGGAWNATIVAEYLQLPGKTLEAHGLGWTIARATADDNFPLMAAAVTVMALFVVLQNQLIWKRLYRLAEGKYGLGV